MRILIASRVRSLVALTCAKVRMFKSNLNLSGNGSTSKVALQRHAAVNSETGRATMCSVTTKDKVLTSHVLGFKRSVRVTTPFCASISAMRRKLSPCINEAASCMFWVLLVLASGIGQLDSAGLHRQHMSKLIRRSLVYTSQWGKVALLTILAHLMSCWRRRTYVYRLSRGFPH
jgi:hypothetical protein